MKKEAQYRPPRGRPERARPPFDATSMRVRCSACNLDLDDVVSGLARLGVRVGRSTVWEWRSGKSRPTVECRRALAKLLRCKVSDLTSGVVLDVAEDAR